MARGVLIIDPGLRLLYNRKGLHADVYFPRGALSLVSYLRAGEVPADFLPVDAFVDESRSFEENYKSFTRVLAEGLEKSEPCLVGVSCVFTMQYPLSVRILETVKKLRPAVKTAMGGSHVTFLDRRSMAESAAIDVVVRGEGEWTLHELASRLRAGRELRDVQGITWREGDAIVQNELRPLGDLAALPSLDYSLLPEGYLENLAINIVASRGCAYRCSYCVEQRFWRNRVRRRPVEHLIEEIEGLSRRFDNLYFTLEDSMFFVNSDYFLDFCTRLKALKKRNFTIGYIVSRVDTVSREGLLAMKEAGVQGIIFGIESASPKVLEKMNKHISLDQAREACRLASSIGINTGTFWIFGHPGDSPDEAELSLAAIEEFYREGLHCGITASMFVPYPGTPFFEAPGEHGLTILSYDWEKWGRFNDERICRLEGFPAEKIAECHHRALETRNRCQVIPRLREWMEKNTTELGKGVRLMYYDMAAYGVPSGTDAMMNILEIARTAYPERFAALVVSSREAVVSLSSDLAFVLPALTILREAAAGVGGQVEGDLGRAFLRKPGLTPAERDAVKELLVEKLRHL